MIRDEFRARLLARMRAREGRSTLDELRAQWRVHSFDRTGEPVVIEFFSEQKLLATARSPEEAARLLGELDVVGSAYTHVHAVDPSVSAKWAGKWTLQSTTRRNSITDDDIRSFRVLPIDFDPARKKGANATQAERDAAFAVAARVYLDIVEILGTDAALSLVSSGNGFWVLVSLDCLPIACRSLIVRGIATAKALYSCAEVDIDNAVHDPRRIGPLAGTRKAKDRHTQDRPHRMTWIAAPEIVEPLDQARLEFLVSTLESRVPEGLTVEVPGFRDDTRGVAELTADTAFGRVSQIRMTDVLLKLGEDPRCPVCPVCGAKGGGSNTSVRVLDNSRWNHFNCRHQTCGQYTAGPAYYVALKLFGVRSLAGEKETSRKVLEWFRDAFNVDIEPPKYEVTSDEGMQVDDHRAQVVEGYVAPSPVRLGAPRQRPRVARANMKPIQPMGK